MAGASVSEMARDIVVALIESGKIQLDANAKKQGEWLGDLFKSLIETLDLSLVPGTQRGRNAWRTRDVGNVRHNDHGLSLLFQGTQDLVVVFCELLDRQTVTDVVDANPNSHEIGQLLKTRLQLDAQQVVGGSSADAEVREFGRRPVFENAIEQPRYITAVRCTHSCASRVAQGHINDRPSLHFNPP